MSIFDIITIVQIKTQADEIRDYFTDASNMPGGFGDGVYFPESVDELSKILRIERRGHRCHGIRSEDGNGRRSCAFRRAGDIAGKAEQD